MNTLRVLAIGLFGFALGGCTLLCAPYCGGATAVHHGSTSLVEFLYPNGTPPPRANSVPELHVPLRVGLAFLPGRGIDTQDLMRRSDRSSSSGCASGSASASS